MLTNTLLNVTFSFLLALFSTSTTHQLEIEVKGIEQLTGNVNICLIGNHPEKYLTGCDWGDSVAATDYSVTSIFENLPAGTYCAYVYHDVDSDNQLDCDGLFGMPSEPYGFSNNPRALFGPPSFEKCTFKVEGNSRILIKLR